jgi:hypothetical protein
MPERCQDESNNDAEPAMHDFARFARNAAALLKELSTFGGQPSALARI